MRLTFYFEILFSSISGSVQGLPPSACSRAMTSTSALKTKADESKQVYTFKGRRIKRDEMIKERSLKCKLSVEICCSFPVVKWLTCERGRTWPAWPRLCWRCDRHKRTLHGSAAGTEDRKSQSFTARQREVSSLQPSTLSHCGCWQLSSQVHSIPHSLILASFIFSTLMTTCNHSWQF